MTNAYRCVLEVLKWTDPKMTMQHITNVSAMWHSACDSHELWTLFIEDADFDPVEIISHSKAGFKATLESGVRTTALGVVDGQLMAFSCVEGRCTKSFGPLTDIFPRYSGAAAVFLSGRELLVCGSESRGLSAIVYYSDERSPLVLPAMHQTRTNQGILLYQHTVFVFGGMSYPNSSEKLAIGDNEWTFLPAMLSPHFSFNPVRVQTSIYICGGNTRICEVYSITQNGYSLLPFRLEHDSVSASFLSGREIVVLCKNFKYIIREKVA